MNSESTFSNAEEPKVTIESLAAIMRNFKDRKPALPKSVSVHPEWLDVFMGNLREEGFVRHTALALLSGLPILTDSRVPIGEYRMDYEYDLRP